MSAPSATNGRIPVWIDTDIALGSPRGDVDDAFAIAAIASDPRARILGISTVFGNTDSAAAAENARRLLTAAGKAEACPVITGAAGPGELTPAAEAIAALADGTHLLALGPLTNLAQALSIRPSLFERIGSVSLVGGNLSSRGRWAPLWPHEFNLARDLLAARAVLGSPGARRLYPLDVLRGFRFRAADLGRLSRCNALGGLLAAGSARWIRRMRGRLRRSFAVWDLVPALDLLGAPGIATAERRLSIGRGGRVLDDPRSAPSQVVVALDPEALRGFFFALLGARSRDPARPV